MNYNQESEILRGSRISAVQGIRSISNWWYWQPFKPETSSQSAVLADKPTYTRIKRPFTQRLLEAATRRKEQGNNPPRLEASHGEKYWSPDHTLPSPSLNSKNTSKAPLKSPISVSREELSSRNAKNAVETKKFRLDVRTPSIMAILASSVVAYQGENVNMSGIGVEQHVGGETAMQIVNSFEMQILLAGATWFIIGMAFGGIVELLEMKWRKTK
jgi:hypothetical protein